MTYKIITLIVASIVFVLPSDAFAKKKRKTDSQTTTAPSAAAAPEPEPAPTPAVAAAETPAQAPAPVAYRQSPAPSSAAAIHIPDAQTQNHLQAAGLVGYGSDHLNFGLGARLGYTLPINLYLGASVQYFLGESQTQSNFGVSASVDMHFFTLAGEVGYDFQVLPNLVVRPLLGIGAMWASGESCVDLGANGGRTCNSGSDSHSLVELGGIGNYFWGPLFAGGELRLEIVSDTAVVFGAHVGYMP